MKMTKSDSQKTILLVDDDMVNLTILKTLISGAGYSVLTAENGREALTVAGKNAPDLIILDIMMPEMDGTELATVLKGDPRTHKIPIIFLSSLISAKEERRDINKTLISYLSKPYKRDQLLNLVRKYLSPA